MYKSEITFCTRELSVKEKIMYKDTSDCVTMDSVVTEENALLLDLDLVIVVHIENDKSESKEYDKYIYVDKNGDKYTSGSESLFRQFYNIYTELDGTDEKVTWKIFKKHSKNYNGCFLTCTII